MGRNTEQPARTEAEQEWPEVDATSDVAERKEKIDADVDAIDEIDDVLEENAAEFVSSFVQKGGQ